MRFYFLWTPLKTRIAHPRTHTWKRTIVLYMQFTLHILVFASLASLTPSLWVSFFLSFSFSTLEYRCLSSTLPLLLLYIYLLLSHRYWSLSLSPLLAFSLVSDLKTEGRSIGRFSSGFSSARRPPRDESRNCSQGSRFERGKKFRSIERTLARRTVGKSGSEGG